MGLAGGLARDSITPALKAALGGGLLAGSLAASATWILLPIFFRAKDRSLEELSRDLMLPTLVTGGIWVAAGLGAGAAFGFGIGGGKDRIFKAALGGAIAAATAAVLYEILAATVFPASKGTTVLAPDLLSRLLARLIMTTLVGLFSAFFLTLSIRGLSSPFRIFEPQMVHSRGDVCWASSAMVVLSRTLRSAARTRFQTIARLRAAGRFSSPEVRSAASGPSITANTSLSVMFAAGRARRYPPDAPRVLTTIPAPFNCKRIWTR